MYSLVLLKFTQRAPSNTIVRAIQADCLATVAATTTATGNLRNTRLPIDQSQSVSHVVSQNTLSHFRISQITITLITTLVKSHDV